MRCFRIYQKKNLDRIHKLINDSVTTGVIPTAWKVGQLNPIPKPGKDPGFIESYRPVCLLACLGKLVDRIVTTRLDFIVEQKRILPHTQAGFRRGRTIEDPSWTWSAIYTASGQLDDELINVLSPSSSWILRRPLNE